MLIIYHLERVYLKVLFQSVIFTNVALGAFP